MDEHDDQHEQEEAKKPQVFARFDSTTSSSEHSDFVHDVAYDFYGSRLASCSSDRTIKVWAKDASTGGWKEQSAYKYLIAADGNSYATGFGGLLLLGSVVLRHESTMNLWFEGMLEDGKDYMKVKYDFSDLAEKVEWLRSHDAEARAIAEAGQRKAEALLSNAGTECYVKKLLNHFAAMLVD